MELKEYVELVKMTETLCDNLNLICKDDVMKRLNDNLYNHITKGTELETPTKVLEAYLDNELAVNDYDHDPNGPRGEEGTVNPTPETTDTTTDTTTNTFADDQNFRLFCNLLGVKDEVVEDLITLTKDMIALGDFLDMKIDPLVLMQVITDKYDGKLFKTDKNDFIEDFVKSFGIF